MLLGQVTDEQAARDFDLATQCAKTVLHGALELEDRTLGDACLEETAAGTEVLLRGAQLEQVLDAVDRVTNRKIERKLEGRRAGDPDALVADNSKILSTLPWRPKHDDLEGIVKDALAWERALAERQG